MRGKSGKVTFASDILRKGLGEKRKVNNEWVEIFLFFSLDKEKKNEK